MNNEIGGYRHTQKGAWALLLYVLGVAFAIASWYMPVPALQIAFFVIGLVMLVLASSFHHLTVEDEDSQLAIRFGPLPLFRKWIFYDDIVEVEKGRTTILDGWGIHWNPWSGSIWAIWGFDCVVIRLKQGTVRLGTDDPDGLVEFLKSRMVVTR